MAMRDRHGRTGGREGVRRFVACVFGIISAVAAATAAPPQPPGGKTPPASDPVVSVRESHGVYAVRATFDVAQPAGAALAVLTDYAQIPRFMPDVRTSVVRERTGGRVLVEQEAVSQFMMFSKRVHLLLEVTERPDGLAFVDRCGRSFRKYDGRWTVVESGDRTTITYEVDAQPSFAVPDFILKRLLRRDAAAMIERLRGAIAARAAAGSTESVPGTTP